MLTTAPLDTPIPIPDLDAIRSAIDAADERAKLLRRFLRVAMRLKVHLGETNRPPSPPSQGGGVPGAAGELARR